jgi:hypothetical protein
MRRKAKKRWRRRQAHGGREQIPGGIFAQPEEHLPMVRMTRVGWDAATLVVATE